MVRLNTAARELTAIGLNEYLVVHGRVRLTEGGGPALLHRLAQVYIGPGATFPPMPNPPPGLVAHTAISKIGGVGDWAEHS